jgi:LPS-assembly protein
MLAWWPVLASAQFTPGNRPKAKKVAGPPPQVKEEHGEPVNVTGQETIFDSRNDVFTVKGDAVMTQGGSVLKADQIDVYRRQRQARATGNVHLIDPDVEMWATEATIDLNREALVLYNAKVYARHDTYHLAGEKIEKLEGPNYEITKGFFTTCGCRKDTPDWAIQADQMDVNVGGKGTANNAKFAVFGYPVAKLPYAVFPADSQRQSGFLSSREGESSIRGFQYLQPYYWAINKSSDATFALDVETSQRIGGMGEYRLTNGPDDYFWGDAAYYNEAIRSDQNRENDIVDNQIADTTIPENRWDGIAMMRQHLTDNLTLYGTAMTVSDSLLLREVNTWTLSSGFGNDFASLRNAISNWGLLDSFENGFARIQGTYNQDLIQPQAFALQRLPEALLSGRQGFGSLGFFDYDASATNFYRDEGLSGWRFDANPQYTLPFRLGDYATAYGRAGVLTNVWGTSGNQLNITPVGTDGLVYNNGVSLGPGQHTEWKGDAIPYAQTGISTILDRVYDVNGTSIEKLKNTIEPFANYSYVPRISQGNDPLFDQYDRMESRSLIMYGFTTRLFARVKNPPQTESNEEAPDQMPDGGASSTTMQNENNATGVPAFNGQQTPWRLLPPNAGQMIRDGDHIDELGQLTIQQAYDISHDISADASHISDLQGLLSIYPTSLVSLGSELDYNPRGHAGITYTNFFLNLQPPPSWQRQPKLYMGNAVEGSFMELSYSYVSPQDTVIKSTAKNGSQLATLRAYSDLYDYLGVYIAPSYDFAAGRLLQAEYGARLKSPCDCWALDAGMTQSYNPNEVSFQFQVTLGGLGSLGQSPFGRNPFQIMNGPTSIIPGF